jgi:type VI secretion system protein VasI
MPPSFLISTVSLKNNIEVPMATFLGLFGLSRLRVCGLFLFLLSLATLSPAIASNEAFRVCALISDGKKRLACFDKIASDLGAKAEVQASKPSNWKVETKVDPMNDSLVNFVSIQALEGANRRGDLPSLIFRCKDKLQDIYVSWGVFISTESTTVTTRIRTEEAFAAKWSVSTDHTATFYPYSVEMIRNLRPGGRLVLQVTPHSDSPITAIFNVDGLDETLKGVKNDCGW